MPIAVVELLVQNPLLLLFIVAAIGFPLGHIQFKGGSLGTAAVLFVGLFVGALHPDLKLPELLYLFGLTLFVYSIGLSSGPTFFAAFRKRGIVETLFSISVLVAAAALVVLLKKLFTLDPETAAGAFAGSLNNTPALASLLDQLKARAIESGVSALLDRPVVGYSITYPMGVLGTILAISFFQRIWKINYAMEALRGEAGSTIRGKIGNQTVLVTQSKAMGRDLGEIRKEQGWPVIFGRIKRGTVQELIGPSTRLQTGDEITIIGPERLLQEIVDYFGSVAPEDLIADRTEFDYRRIFVSNPQVAGRKISDLKFLKDNEATLTRIRRGDVELLATGNTILEPGDRIRVLCRKSKMDEITAYFGDSYRAISEIDFLSFSTGLALGILVGLIPFALPGGVTLKLGFAGGPLVVGLILGRLYRTGPIVWVLPYTATLTLRQIGLILFLAGVGTRAGYTFFSTLGKEEGLAIFAAGTLITFFSAVSALWIGYRVLKIPMGRLTGMLAGLHTQPAVLGFALEQAKNDDPNTGYAMIHPIATITKIVLAQILLNYLAG
ncbi:MAG: transporter [Bdellovibrionales bacterium GWB1_52_6]|nr:MAG: transporter [Bdellovibrionales bacterium GWB1_52_6]OFZ03516.1 MAG: transporter [Bdellovibrionales bacterium GWA1_52_35]HCM41103.1 transporter [Bdellovibrionales bacterium]